MASMDEYIRHAPCCRYCGHEMYPHSFGDAVSFLCEHCGSVSPMAGSRAEAYAKATARPPKSTVANKGTFQAI